MPDNRQLIRFTALVHCVMHIMLLCMLHLKYDNGTFRPQTILKFYIVIATFTKLALLPIFEFSLSNLILVFI